MMTKGLMRRVATARDERLSRFYNPMWNREWAETSRMVRQEPTISVRIVPRTSYWNYPDQVLVGYDLMDRFLDDQFRILTSIPDGQGSERRLLRELDVHWGIEFSDHLPILFDLDLKQNEA